MAVILIDFDGTCVRHEFPAVGKEIGAAPVLKALTENGHQLVLFTMRCDFDGTENLSGSPTNCNEPKKYLQDAVDWFVRHNIPLHGINTNPDQKRWTTSPKAYGHYIIDDTAIGVPLNTNYETPFVNWYQMVDYLHNLKLLTTEQVYILDTELERFWRKTKTTLVP